MHSDLSTDLGGPYFGPELIDARGRLSRLHKGGPSQAQINDQKKQAKAQEALLKQQISAQNAATKAAMRSMEMPQVAPADIAAPPPAQQSTSSDQIAAQQDVARQAKQRRGLSKTRVAGETGGFLGGGSAKLGSGGATLMT